MKLYNLIIFLLLFSVGVFAQENSSFKVSRKTPEPGTKLSCMSYQMVKQVNKAVATANPDSIFDNKKHKLPKCIWKSGYYIDKSIGEDSIPIRIFYPDKRSMRHSNEKSLPVLMFYHGGGFIWGSLDMFHTLAQKLSKTLGCMVVLPDYRLAPEYPYPTPVNDCVMTLDWVFQNIALLGGNPEKVGLIGDSAGANLALVTALENHRSKARNIAFLVLYYPTTTMVDTIFDSRRYFAGYEGDWYVLNRSLLEEIKQDYIGENSDTLWQVSPLYAEYNDSMPPTLIITAQCDPLRDEGEALAEKMKQSGVDVSLIRYDKTIHGFVSLYPVIRQGRKAIRETRKFSEKYF